MLVMKLLFQKVRNTFEMMRLKVIHLFLKRKGIMDEVLFYLKRERTVIFLIIQCQSCLQNCMTKIMMVMLMMNTKIQNR